jgi:antitoxin ParD1/3/4
MPLQSELTITLTPELQKFVEDRVGGGLFASASDLICEGLRRLEAQELDADAAFSELKQKLERAAAQAEHGELLDGEQVMARLRAKLEARRAGKPDAE